MNYKIDDLIDILKKLRAPGGCPWDREQTHESIKTCLIEEAYEVADAVDSKDPMKLADELGDVLLQVVFHAQLGVEEGTFSMDDVYRFVCEKMIRRHPHVFKDVNVENSEEVLANWDAIKKEENGQKTVSESMRTITKSLPAILRAGKIQKKARRADYQLPTEQEIRSQLSALIENISKENAYDTIGKIQFLTAGLSEIYSVNSEDALETENKRFIFEFSTTENEKKC